MQDFKKLRAWQKSHALALAIYRATDLFPDGERFGLKRQLRDAAISVGSNLAEGSSRQGDADFRRFVFFALGSLSEIEAQLLVARDLGFLSRVMCGRLWSDVVEVRRMLCTLNRRLSGKFGASPRSSGRNREPEAGGL